MVAECSGITRKTPEVLFCDNRDYKNELCDGRILRIHPDQVIDFRNMPFEDNSFRLVVFDPPHLLNAGEKSWLAQKYGILPEEWQDYLKAGFDECMRVLKPGCFMVFKWCEEQIKTADVLKVFGMKPLLGDKRSKTRWMLFEKAFASDEQFRL